MSRHRHFDLAADDSSLAGSLQDDEHPQSEIAVALRPDGTRPPAVAG